MGCPADWLIIPLLVSSVPLNPVLKISSEVTEGGWVWGQSVHCNLQGPTNGVGVETAYLQSQAF